MKIKNLHLEQLKIPFQVVFKHASAERSETQSVLAIIESDNGLKGYGEGCPREYVTGESIESCMAFFDEFRKELIRIETLGDLKAWILSHREDIDSNPAAFCALEIALLDLLGKETGQSVDILLGFPEVTGKFQYTAVLGIGSSKTFQKQLAFYKQLHMFDFKLKLSGELKGDKDRMHQIKAIPSTALRVRLDANNLWAYPEEAIAYIRALPHPVFAIEEPLKTADFEGLVQVYKGTGLKIILDESFCTFKQFRFLKNIPKAWVINLRVSKMGGLLRSIEIAENALKLKIPIIIGAQVGETSILSRVALTLANRVSKNLLAQEGAFGIYLLQWDIIPNPIQFSDNGLYKMQKRINDSGFGLDVRYPSVINE